MEHSSLLLLDLLYSNLLFSNEDTLKAGQTTMQ